MSIDRLGPVDPVQRLNKTHKPERPAEKPGSDSVSFSEEAKLKADILRMDAQVRDSSDVRNDRIAEVKEKLRNPSYINDAVVEVVADRIMDMFDV